MQQKKFKAEKMVPVLPKRVKKNCVLDSDLVDRVQVVALRERRDWSAMVSVMIEDWLAEDDKAQGTL
jgi:hypothetical protein